MLRRALERISPGELSTANRLSVCRFWRAAAFSGNGLRTSVLYRRFLVFGLRALALTELRRMQQRVSRSTNRETEFNCCHFQKFSCG